MTIFNPGPTLNNADWFGYPTYLTSPATGVPAAPYTTPLLPDPATIATLMVGVGFSTMRIFVDPVPFIYLTGANLTAAYALLINTINTVNANGIKVIVVVAPPTTDPNAGTWSNADLFTFPAYFTQYTTLMGAMATKLGTVTIPSMVCMELLNEPSTTNNSDWQTKAGTLASAARAGNSTITLIVSGNNLSHYSDLTIFTPLADANIIYTFHYYEPFTFTHQGASYVNAPISGFSNLPYPARLIGAGGTLPTGGDASWLALLGFFAWNHTAATIQTEFATVTAWCTANSIAPSRIFVGEFGAHMPFVTGLGATNQDRANYCSAVCFAANSAQFSWGFFHLDGEFGILQNTSPLSFDPLILGALQLGPVQGRLIGNIIGATPGASLTLTDSASGKVQLVGNALQVGPTLPTALGPFNITITETLLGSPNSPRSTVLPISVIAG